MKKVCTILLTTLLFLASCGPGLSSEEEVLQNDEDANVETAIVPAERLGEDRYRMILPYQPSEARGTITNQITNRLDIDEMEEGLRRHSTDVFDPETLYFQEGNYLSGNMVYGFIDNLNPDSEDDWSRQQHEDNPRTLSHILEQNYLNQNDDNTVSLAGVSLAIALKSEYTFEAPANGPSYTYDISMNEMLETGYGVAQEVVESMREMEDFPDVPILIGLYREQGATSPVPGNYVAKTVVPSGTTEIDSWESIDEQYVLLPSNEASSYYPSDAEVFDSFSNSVAEFFPNYVGTIGEAFYQNEELQQLSIEIPMEFYGKAEVIGFTQYVYGLVQDTFPNYYDLEIMITSSDGVESFIKRNAGEEQPNTHVFH